MNFLKKIVNEVSITFRPLKKYPFPPSYEHEAALFEDVRFEKEFKKENVKKDAGK